MCPSRYCFNQLDIFIHLGLTQRPAQCVNNLRIVIDREDLYIMPGVVNCISCALDSMGDVAWQIEVDGDPVPATTPTAAQFVTVMNNYLIIAMPEEYVLPGTSGRQDIVCTSLINGNTLEARLASPSKIDEYWTVISKIKIEWHNSIASDEYHIARNIRGRKLSWISRSEHFAIFAEY